jgi:glucose-6-phosphate-specific signal transduction histidine kinase
MIVSTLPILSEKEQSAQLLKPFGITLGIWNIIECILKPMGTEWNLTLISLMFSIITIYFHFQLITNIANLDIEKSKRKRLLVLRTTTVMLHTILALSLFIPTTLNKEIYSYILMFIALPQVIICLWISGELFGLSNTMKEKEMEVSKYADAKTNEEMNTDENLT